MKVRVGTATKSVPAAKTKVAAGVKNISSIAYYNGTTKKTVKTFTSALSASVSNDLVLAEITDGGTASTKTVTVTPSGGTAPYTYAWTRFSGEGTVNNPTKATTLFFATLSAEDEATGTFRCTVTDSLGATATAQVLATFRSYSSI